MLNESRKNARNIVTVGFSIYTVESREREKLWKKRVGKRKSLCEHFSHSAFARNKLSRLRMCKYSNGQREKWKSREGERGEINWRIIWKMKQAVRRRFKVYSFHIETHYTGIDDVSKPSCVFVYTFRWLLRFPTLLFHSNVWLHIRCQPINRQIHTPRYHTSGCL